MVDPAEILPNYSRRPVSDAEKAILVAFTTLTTYKASDVIGLNAATKVVVTGNGGKYQLNRAGTIVRHLSGPAPVKVKRKKVAATTKSSSEE